MVTILSLWLPILLAAIAVFVVSSLVHMVLRYHKSDYRRLPDEDAVVEVLGRSTLTPGLYHFPYCESPKEMGSEEMLGKFERGPVGLLTVLPSGAPSMGKLLGLWFVYCAVVSLFVAYLTGRTMSPGADFSAVFRVAGTVAFMTYGLSQVVDSIWKGATWSITAKNLLDGLLYALATAAVFGWLWPR